MVRPSAAGGVEDGGQRLGGVVQLELGEVAAQLLVEAGLRGRGRCRAAAAWWFSLLAWGSPDRRWSWLQVVRVFLPCAAAA